MKFKTLTLSAALAVSLVASAFAADTPDFGDLLSGAQVRVAGNTTNTSLAVKATNTFGFAANPNTNETITVAGRTYIFKSTLTQVDGAVKIGSSAAITATNFAFAINAGEGSGTLYGSNTVAHSKVFATVSDTNVTVSALYPGVWGNDFACSDTTTNGAWTASATSGGKMYSVNGIKAADGAWLDAVVTGSGPGATNTFTLNLSLGGTDKTPANSGNGMFTLVGTFDGAKPVYVSTNIPSSYIGDANSVTWTGYKTADTNAFTVRSLKLRTIFAK